MKRTHWLNPSGEALSEGFDDGLAIAIVGEEAAHHRYKNRNDLYGNQCAYKKS
jgi:hypothetical protein